MSLSSLSEFMRKAVMLSSTTPINNINSNVNSIVGMYECIFLIFFVVEGCFNSFSAVMLPKKNLERRNMKNSHLKSSKNIWNGYMKKHGKKSFSFKMRTERLLD
jgi:hypothetical protein